MTDKAQRIYTVFFDIYKKNTILFLNVSCNSIDKLREYITVSLPYSLKQILFLAKSFKSRIPNYLF